MKRRFFFRVNASYDEYGRHVFGTGYLVVGRKYKRALLREEPGSEIVKCKSVHEPIRDGFPHGRLGTVSRRRMRRAMRRAIREAKR